MTATEIVHRTRAGRGSSVVTMPAPQDPLVPADAVTVGETTLVPDLFRPVAAVVAAGSVRWLTWPGVALPDRAIEEVEVLPTASGAWLLYRSDESGLEEDGRGRSGTVAVHLGPSGVSDGVELDGFRPLGADEGGLWLGDPRDASEWMSNDDDDVEDPDESVDPADIDPATLPRTPEEPFWPDPSEWTEPTDEDGTDDGDEDEDEDDAGYTWSIGFAHTDDTSGTDVVFAGEDPGQRDRDRLGRADPIPAPGPPLPTPPTELVRVAPDGTRTVISVDHLVDDVRREGTTLVVRYFPTGPRRVVHEDDDGGGWWDVVYEPREVRVDVSSALPASIDTDALQSEPAAEEDEDAWEQAIDAREARRAPWLDRLDLDGVPDTRWPLWDADEVSRARAVDRLRAQFIGLDERVIVWTRDHPEPRSAPSDHRDVQVVTEGSWPDTEVVVSFEHTAVPFLRLRRRYRVFDASGRPLDWSDATTYLMEDIDTALPPRSRAVDGVLDI
jgi:hypothetical protein